MSMGILSAVFGNPGDQYSPREFPRPELEIKKLVSPQLVHTLEQREEAPIEQAILLRRGHDGKISLRQIYEVLLHLQHAHTISENDRHGLMHLCQAYAAKHHGIY